MAVGHRDLSDLAMCHVRLCRITVSSATSAPQYSTSTAHTHQFVGPQPNMSPATSWNTLLAGFQCQSSQALFSFHMPTLISSSTLLFFFLKNRAPPEFSLLPPPAPFPF